MDFEALGISKEDIIDRIVDNAVTVLVEEYRNDSARDVRDEVRRISLEGIREKVTAIINDEATKALEGRFQPLTSWGEENGKPTSIRQMFVDAAREWWAVKVDSKGNPDVHNYGSKAIPRAEYVAKKVMTDVVSETFKLDIQRIINALRDEFKAAVSKAMTDIVTAHFAK